MEILLLTSDNYFPMKLSFLEFALMSGRLLIGILPNLQADPFELIIYKGTSVCEVLSYELAFTKCTSMQSLSAVGHCFAIDIEFEFPYKLT